MDKHEKRDKSKDVELLANFRQAFSFSASKSLITDAGIEAAAKAIHQTDWYDHRTKWHQLLDWEQDNLKVEARAAVEAYLTVIQEETP
jgi:hypothetical protein